MFRLTGRKSGKLAFKETRFYHVTKEAVKLSCTATEKDIDVGIMELLKHVKDRSSKQKRLLLSYIFLINLCFSLVLLLYNLIVLKVTVNVTALLLKK